MAVIIFSRATVKALFLCSLSALGSFASPPLQADSLSAQRALYQQAKEQLNSKQMAQFSATKARLKNYPLYPYLEQRELEQSFATISQSHIDRYAKRYAALPSTYLLQRHWLNFLAKEQRWNDYLLAASTADINTEEHACYARKARLNTGKITAALDNIATFWNVGHSISDICDPVFDAWISKQGGPSSDLAQQRFWKAVAKNNIGLASYLQRFITEKEHQQPVEQFFKVRANPALLETRGLLKGKTVATQETYLYGLASLSRKDPQLATRIWLNIRANYAFSAEQRQALNRRLAGRLINQPDTRTDELLATLNQPLDSAIQERRIIFALQQQNWSSVYQLIDQLPQQEQQEERWIYWKTIAASHTQDLKPAYSKAFTQLSRARSYYGLLAADILQSRFHLNPMQNKADTKIIKQLQHSASFHRMHELYLNNELYLARREWNHALDNSDKPTLHAASAIAHQWGWHAQTIRGIAQAQYWDDVALRFPMPFNPLFADKAQQFNIDTNWARAIARQESAFHPYAQSRVGARGLMQLMPKTAQDTARKNNIVYRRTSELYSPAINIALGAAYLAEMKAKFQGNQVYATAAYNAGPHRVSRWLKERGELPIDIWIETIPFSETRKYVMNVMAYHAVYSALAGKPAHLLQGASTFSLAMQSSSGTQQSASLRRFITTSNNLDTTQSQ